MSRIIRPLRKNILIVCEGTVTEPEYFAVLKKMALDWAIWEEVEIRPKPRSEEDVEDVVKTPPPHKSIRLKRQLKMVEVPDEADEIEQKYLWRQTPVNYVKEARSGLKDDTYEEVWAVFDKNGHPSHLQAFNLAREPVNTKIVNIAFSSISIEHWILLHFEQNSTMFVKSECKEEGRYLECGTGNHPDDCWGSRCVSGYLRVHHYMSCSTKKSSTDFHDLISMMVSQPFRQKAYKNVAWLRFTIPHDSAAPYLTNPYSNVDDLVKRLLGEESQIIEWAAIEQKKEWQSLLIRASITDLSVELELQNTGTNTMLINGTDVALFLHKDEESISLIPKDKMLLPGNIVIQNSLPVPDRFIQSDVFEVRKGENRLFFHLKP